MATSPSPSPTAYGSSIGSSWTAFFDIDISQFFQILFWVVAGTVAVLTYRQAKRSVFQPLRVEVFKLQLVVLTKVNENFVSRSEIDLRAHFDLQNCIDFNATLLLEQFLKDVYKLRSEPSLLERQREKFPGGLIRSPDDLELIVAPADMSNAQGDASLHAEAAASVTKDWNDYFHPVIALSKGFSDAHDGLTELARDPLVPRELAALLNQLAEAALHNVMAIGPVLKQAASKLPSSYPTEALARKADLRWVSNIWNDQALPLEPIASKIGEFTRAFVEVERSGFAERTGPGRRSSSTGNS